jgi:hypothetical protein
MKNFFSKKQAKTKGRRGVKERQWTQYGIGCGLLTIKVNGIARNPILLMGGGGFKFLT